MLFKDVKDQSPTETGLKAYLGGIQKTMTWETWKPFVEGAEQTYILPAIGPELYGQLTDSASLSAAMAILKHKLKAALAWFAYVDAMPSLITVTGDGGMVVSSVANTAAMPKWLYVDTKKQHQERADRYLEAALVWLESQADEFPIWKTSPGYTIQKGQLISSATEATKHFPAIQNSRRLYLSIRQYFNAAEEDFLQPIIGPDLLLQLKAKLSAGAALTSQEQLVLTYARKAVVLAGFAQAIPFLNMNADFRLVSETDGIINEDALDGQRLNIIRNDTLEKAHKKAAELTHYLNSVASETVFPAYYQSAFYTPPPTK